MGETYRLAFTFRQSQWDIFYGTVHMHQLRIRLHRLQNLQPADLGHHHVKQQYVGALLAHEIQGFVRVQVH